MELGEYAEPRLRAKNNHVQKRTQKVHHTCKQNVKNYFLEFCDKTSMHGFNLLGERGRTIPEKIWWAVVITTAFALCIAMIVQTTIRWINFPVIVSFATSQTHIFDVPFPAVTICPDSKTQAALFNYTKAYIEKSNNKQLTAEEQKTFDYISLVCDSPEEFFNESQEFSDEEAINVLKQVAPDFIGSIFHVEWLGISFDAAERKDLFVPILTSEGVCYAFNILDRSEIFTDAVKQYGELFSTNGKKSEWSLDEGYAKKSDLGSYPRRTLSGLKGGFTIVMRAISDDLDYACGDSLQGFKVLLHNPAVIPRAKQDFFKVPLDQAVVGAIKPKITTTSSDLMSYEPKERECYFSSEKKLKFFKIYNQANCLNECLVNFTLNNCGCVSFHMPRDNSVPTCGPAKKLCMDDAKALFVEHEITYKYQENKDNTVGKCHCLPSCSSLDFTIELSQSDWDWKERLNIEKQKPSWDPSVNEFVDKVHLSYLNLFYKDMQFTTSERNELYSRIDFWANIGGVLGLFTGFTFISGCEVLYYLTLRLGCNIRKYGTRNWPGFKEGQEEKE